VLKLHNVHPGEVLREHFLRPFGITRAELAHGMRIPVQHVVEIVRGKRAIDADLAIRLAAVLGTAERFWMGLQADYDLEAARYLRKEAEGSTST
jgi:addiction module HigA family antidote